MPRKRRKQYKGSSREYQRDRKLRKKALNEDMLWTTEMASALKYFQTSCALCFSKDNLQIDHVMPLSRGFALRPGNAIMLCRSCNASKSNKRITELNEDAQIKVMWHALNFKRHWHAKQDGRHL